MWYWVRIFQTSQDSWWVFSSFYNWNGHLASKFYIIIITLNLVFRRASLNELSNVLLFRTINTLLVLNNLFTVHVCTLETFSTKRLYKTAKLRKRADVAKRKEKLALIRTQSLLRDKEGPRKDWILWWIKARGVSWEGSLDPPQYPIFSPQINT